MQIFETFEFYVPGRWSEPKIEEVWSCDMKLTFRYKGGPGSGFHGHSGRPGKVGGSAGAQSSVQYFHGTSGSFIKSIQKKGLIGNGIWATTNKKSALAYGFSAARHSKANTVCLVEVDKSYFPNVYDSAINSPTYNVPPDAIIAFHVYDYKSLESKWLANQSYDDVTPIEIIRMKELTSNVYVPFIMD